MRLFSLLALSAIVAVGCQKTSTTSSTTSTEYKPGVAESAEKVRPIGVGATAPSATMETVDGQSTTIAKVYQAKPTALIFYRGGWCPYCNTHLAELAKNEAKLRELGFQVVGVSPDRPSELVKSIGKNKLNYDLLSDADAELAKAFGLAFKVDAPTIERYKGYGIDLEAASGYDHHILPVPAVYLIDTDGKIQYAYWDVNYKNRLSADELLAAAKSISR